MGFVLAILSRNGKNYKNHTGVLAMTQWGQKNSPDGKISIGTDQFYSAGGWIRFSICAKADFKLSYTVSDTLEM